MAELKKATSVAEYMEKMQGFVSEEGVAHAQAFTPRADDIIVATYAKAGTTWMQQIVHGLRTKGDMDFGEITDVVPWIELAYDTGWDIHAEQKAKPRAFKTHHAYDTVPKGARYIWVVRDPKDTAVSFYNFMNGWFLEPGTIDINDFIQDFFLKRELFTGYWAHLISWWNVKDHETVLPLTFEDMKEDLPGAVQRVADFIGYGDDAQAIDIATKQAHFSFMKAHESQFDDHPIAENRNLDLGLPADARSSKVKTGTVGGHKNIMNEETAKLLDAKWAETVKAKLGFADYAALREAIR